MVSNIHIPDIDIDMKNREDVLSILKHYPASIINMDKQSFTKHNSGVYFQTVPHDPLTLLCSLDHKVMESLGFNKIDLLHNNIYKPLSNHNEMIQYLNMPIQWDLFKHEEIVTQLFQISNHYKTIKLYPPTSIEDLAILIALIRPGKKYLIGYSWETIKEKIWLKEQNDYVFKKSHAFGYAHVIILQLNMLCYMENYSELSNI